MVGEGKLYTIIAINGCRPYHILSCNFCVGMCCCHYRASQSSIGSCEKGKRVNGGGLVSRVRRERELIGEEGLMSGELEHPAVGGGGS